MLEKRQKYYSQPVDLVVIGASTGGPFALITLLKSLNKINFPIIIAQHIPKNFTKNLIENLCLETKHQIIEGYHGLILENGHIIICRGGIDTRIHFENNNFVLKEVTFSDHLPHPSVDVLFESAALLPSKIIGIILTGLGNDGCKGSKKLLEANNVVIAQAPETCLAENMPNAVIEQNAASYVFTLSEISSYLKT